MTGTSPRASMLLPWRKTTLAAIACGLAGVAGMLHAAAVYDFNDITSWVGEGENRAAVAIDWDGQSDEDESLVWGYRWDGQATGEDMLMAVVAADSRLYLKRGEPAEFPFGIAVFGLGYDANADNDFRIDDEQTMFDSLGVAISPQPIPPRGVSSPDDVYQEGWTPQRAWTYGVGAGNPWQEGQWNWSPQGATQRMLTDGSWDSWAFNLTATTDPDKFAASPMAALLLESADFDANGVVDGADALAWQRGLGLTSGAARMDGDATRDGAVDAADLATWFQQAAGEVAFAFSSARSVAAVPEPTISGTCASAIVFWIFASLNHYRSD